MARLTAARRRKIPKSEFAVPGGVRGHSGPSFPLDTKGRDEAAIKLAPKSQAAGNISPSTEKRIVATAKHKLGKSSQTSTPARSKAQNAVRKAKAVISARKAMGY